MTDDIKFCEWRCIYNYFEFFSEIENLQDEYQCEEHYMDLASPYFNIKWRKLQLNWESDKW